MPVTKIRINNIDDLYNVLLLHGLSPGADSHKQTSTNCPSTVWLKHPLVSAPSPTEYACVHM